MLLLHHGSDCPALLRFNNHSSASCVNNHSSRLHQNLMFSPAPSPTPCAGAGSVSIPCNVIKFLMQNDPTHSVRD
ncbi:hypothetical protein M758_1G029600 [Ceratodon purpureus]|nr:hypothetical protein M758_1G029600 [Ceratodon purpureus]